MLVSILKLACVFNIAASELIGFVETKFINEEGFKKFKKKFNCFKNKINSLSDEYLAKGYKITGMSLGKIKQML
jgi:hypothetical protein